MFELDIFFSGDDNTDAYFGLRWSVLPETGDSIAITDAEGVELVGHVEQRVFISALNDDEERLRVQLHVTVDDRPKPIVIQSEEAAA